VSPPPARPCARWIGSLAVLALAGLPAVAAAAECVDGIARAVSVQGSVQVRRAGEAGWATVRLNDPFCPGDLLRLEPRSRAAVQLRSGALLRLDQNTTIAFVATAPRDTSWIELLLGAVHFISRISRGLTIQTPFVNGTIEGTEFWVEVTADQATLAVLEGRVKASNAAGALTLESGQSAVARAGQAPTLRPIVVTPSDAVQWAIYYPPLPRPRPDDFPDRAGVAWPALVRRSLDEAGRGNLAAAFDALGGVPPDVADARVLLYRADLLLAVGRVDEATVDIDRVLAVDPVNSGALALRSIVAVARNARADALGLARQAVERDPRSPAARLALSYAQQAAFDLEGARASVQEAVALAPDDALARARLAELWLSVGDLDRALESATEAVARDLRSARAQTVLGFAALTQIRLRQAAEAFERAIELDPAAPLPRLGLGLTRIRSGDLEEGQRQLEIAVSLDPGNSLLRSYLGKVYYERRASVLAADQYRLAQDLDPQDPTPWLYEAIRLQSVNRPVEALQSLERSIQLNDNRAVDRSRFLLEQDRATREANRARIYDDLGFDQLALVEGWRSLATDPANYSAHRFLADSYSVLPRHEIARVSEVLQSQLLQPININPVPPILAVSNSFILAGTGPSTASLNEFNPLFERNRFSARLSGVAGGNSTYGDELVASGLYNRGSVSVGQFHYETEGFRENNDFKQDIYNVFAQVELTSRTSVQGEFRYIHSTRGDLDVRIDPDNFRTDYRQEDEGSSVRLGARHAFSPTSILLASAIYQRSDVAFSFGPENPGSSEQDGFLGELQYLLRRDRGTLIVGVGYGGADRTQATPEVSLDTEIRHANFYAYVPIFLPYRLTVIPGLSADLFDGIVHEDQINPKFGVTWNPVPLLTLRAAVFRTLERTLTSSQTLEPTQVAGFNQFFADGEGTSAWRYGIGADATVTRNVYVGTEFSWRDLKVPFQDIGPEGPVFHATWSEQLGRAYLYWAPHPWFALTADYLYERFERDIDLFNDGVKSTLETHRIPLGVAFFHPTGFSARFSATYVHQRGSFGEPAETKGDSFWVADAAIAYRLPKRWGLISIEGRNLFDQKFAFQDTDPSNPRMIPDRVILLRFTLAY
jgi:tetratricopeptide (TPR) repeat protein